MATPEVVPRVPVNRVVQLVAGVVCMVMIANLQYGWTYFVDPINAKFHWGRPAIQVAFTIFVATETWLVPVEGWFVDKFGPRIVVMIGASWLRWRGRSTRLRARCRCCISARRFPVSAPARCTAPAWATR